MPNYVLIDGDTGFPFDDSRSSSEYPEYSLSRTSVGSMSDPGDPPVTPEQRGLPIRAQFENSQQARTVRDSRNNSHMPTRRPFESYFNDDNIHNHRRGLVPVHVANLDRRGPYGRRRVSIEAPAITRTRYEDIASRPPYRVIQRQPNASMSPNTSTNFDRSEEEESDESEPVLGKGDSLWNPSSRKNMTIHLEIDVEEDLQIRIEEAAHLKRLGHFHKAHDYFQDNLANHLHEPLVALEYADMLLAQGDFRRVFETFDVESLTVTRDVVVLDADKLNLSMVLQLARCCSKPNLRLAYDVALAASVFLKCWKRTAREEISSTEIQILCRYLTLVHHIYSNSSLATRADFDLDDAWDHWAGLYHNLLEEGRCWDVRDVILAFARAFGLKSTCKFLVGTETIMAGISKVVEDWKAMIPDDDSNLCLLDILVCFCKSFSHRVANDASLIGPTNIMFDEARKIATAIKKANQESIQCRSYMEWILAEEEYARIRKKIQLGKGKADASFIDPSFFQQSMAWTTWAGVLPIYVPAGSESPGWPGSNSVALSPPSELLETVLHASRELGDFSVQVSCLREMICSAQNPSELFSRLIRLQVFMGDKLGVLQSLISEYLVANDEESCRVLKMKLDEIQPKLPLWDTFYHPVMEWCYRRVLHALLLTLEGVDSENTKAEERLVKEGSPNLPNRLPAKMGETDDAGLFPTPPNLVVGQNTRRRPLYPISPPVSVPPPPPQRIRPVGMPPDKGKRNEETPTVKMKDDVNNQGFRERHAPFQAQNSNIDPCPSSRPHYNDNPFISPNKHSDMNPFLYQETTRPPNFSYPISNPSSPFYDSHIHGPPPMVATPMVPPRTEIPLAYRTPPSPSPIHPGMNGSEENVDIEEIKEELSTLQEEKLTRELHEIGVKLKKEANEAFQKRMAAVKAENEKIAVALQKAKDDAVKIVHEQMEIERQADKEWRENAAEGESSKYKQAAQDIVEEEHAREWEAQIEKEEQARAKMLEEAENQAIEGAMAETIASTIAAVKARMKAEETDERAKGKG